MRMEGKNGIALLLIALGALILFGKIGFGLGHLMGYLIPAAMVFLGYVGIRQGSKFFGWLFFALGVLCLLVKLSGLIVLIVAAGLIIYGISMLKKRSNVS